MSIEIQLKIINLIKNKHVKNVGIIMHNNADGDCVGSAVALEECLLKCGKKVDIILHDKISSKFSSIIGKNRVNYYKYPIDDYIYDIIFMLDVSDENRSFVGVKNYCKTLIVIDHHKNSKKYGDIYLNENASSTGIIIYKIIKKLVPITENIATAIYLTIQSDTNNFTNSAINSEAFIIASELIEYNADIQLTNLICNKKTLSYINLMSNCLKNVIYDKKYKLTYLTVNEMDIINSDSNYEEASILIEEIRNINDTDIAYLFIEINEGIIIRGRSKNININNILNNFGGGGHDKSSGCFIVDRDIYDVKDEIILYTKQYIDKNNF